MPAEAALWSAPPFSPVRRDGWLLARRAADVKGGFALATLATARDGVLADAVVLLEPTDLGTDAGRRGILLAELTVAGRPPRAEAMSQ